MQDIRCQICDLKEEIKDKQRQIDELRQSDEDKQRQIDEIWDALAAWRDND